MKNKFCGISLLVACCLSNVGSANAYDASKYHLISLGCGTIISAKGIPDVGKSMGSGSDVAMVAAGAGVAPAIAAGFGVLLSSAVNYLVGGDRAGVGDEPIEVVYKPDYGDKQITIKLPNYKDSGLFGGGNPATIVLRGLVPNSKAEPLGEEDFLSTVKLIDAKIIKDAGKSPDEPTPRYGGLCMTKNKIAWVNAAGTGLELVEAPANLMAAKQKYIAEKAELKAKEKAKNLQD